ncbi:MAG: GGDEF domain-containing protein [Candidatus Dormibacteraeota bacterium]|nr:GGDEF domain-containing protein [Candidatus Dormibacteraeota bacterium]MBV9526387.1 GGDEF domain-containing protein [Candidatus Dormibacteraeota bacterium]
MLIASKWVEEYRGRAFHFGWDFLEALVLLAVATIAGSALSTLMLLYMRVAFGTLHARPRRAALLTAAYAASYAGAVILTTPRWGLSTQSVIYALLGSGFVAAPPIMQLLSRTLAHLEDASRRDRALRDAMLSLSSALTVDDVCRGAEPALRRLLSDASVRVRIVGAERAATLTQAQRERVHRGGLQARDADAATLWGADDPAPPSVFAVAMSTIGLVVLAADTLSEADRVVVLAFMEHLSIHVEAATLREIGERRRVEAVVRQSEDHFRQLFERNPQPMWLYDAESFRILAVNEAAMALYGYTRAEFLEMTADALAVEETGGSQHQLKDGRVIDVETDTGSVVYQGRDAVLLLARDVTEQRVLQKRLEHNALHDPLTGLPNQLLLRNRLRRALAKPARRTHDRQVAMIVFDLDGFKTVNDTLGHNLGDRVISVVAARLSRSIKSTDTAARLGGDEFAVLLDATGGSTDALAAAGRLVDEIRRPITIQGQTVVITASAGVAMAQDDDRKPEELLGDADIAMSMAKGRGSGTCVLFDSAFRTALLERMHLQRELRAALSGEQLSVVYQPQVDLGSGRVVAVEALVRWHHPVRGPVPPDVFIPVAEESGLVSTIDTWVLRTACRTLRSWFDEGLPPMRVAVNLSGRDLEREDLAESVRAALEESHLDPWRLELELTESVAVSQTDAAITRLAELRAMGVRIAIDDFGTGFSMFGRLRDLPIDRLKIDRSLVTDLERDDDTRTIVASTVAMGHALGLDLVAEGVETVEAADALRDMDCDGAQGYLFSRPQPADAILPWLRARAAAAAPAVSA